MALRYRRCTAGVNVDTPMHVLRACEDAALEHGIKYRAGLAQHAVGAAKGAVLTAEYLVTAEYV